ncbi:MAG: DMP19 family protein [Clostridia bacterium]|nr:DMP19 family protein [Clostridia bacterium]
MIIKSLNKLNVEKEPYLVWNAFINVIGLEEYNDLNEIQRIPHLCYWYDSEVNNGGHLQYFENCGISRLKETIAALEVLGAIEQANILKEASDKYMKKRRNPIRTVFEFVKKASEGEYEEYDNRFYSSEIQLDEYLKIYLDRNLKYFVEIV